MTEKEAITILKETTVDSLKDIDNNSTQIMNCAVHIILTELEKKEYLYKKTMSDLVKAEAKVINQDKIIDKMIDNIMIHYQVKTIRKMCCPTCEIGERSCTHSGIHRNCIKRHFEKKVEEMIAL